MISFPEEVCFLYADADDEVSFGEYRDKFDILNKISPYELELTQDGLLAFGILFHDKNSFMEVLVKRAKYIQLWGVDKDQFVKTMEMFFFETN